MLSTKLKEAAGNGADATLYVDDVFSTYLYTGTGAAQTITNGIDLAGKGGLVWVKWRNGSVGSGSNTLVDTARGANKVLISNSTIAEFTQDTVSAFNANGFNLTGDGGGKTNYSGDLYASWTFRKAAKFFDVLTHAANTSVVINHNLGVVPACIIVKSTANADQWGFLHRGTNGYMFLNLTDAANGLSRAGIGANTSVAWVGATSTTLDFSNWYNANTAFVVYLFAHDPSPTGIIQCGSFTTNGSGGVDPVNLGWEPQFILFKRTDGGGGVWTLLDTMRGWSLTAGNALNPNNSNPEADAWGTAFPPNSTGFSMANGALGAGWNYIYIAIRRPNKPPTTGTQVFMPAYQNDSTPVSTGFVTDMFLEFQQAYPTYNTFNASRLTYSGNLRTASTQAEEFGNLSGDNFSGGNSNTALSLGIFGALASIFAFKRAPEFFDEVCGNAVGYIFSGTHNLTVVPEMLITKDRTGSSGWAVYHSALGVTKYLSLQATSAAATASPDWSVTSTTFSDIGTSAGPTDAMVAYLFATCAGVSKVGSYTGNGTGQAIACGFSAGARFVLIKRTDSSGGWYTFDSARGLTVGSSPYLLLNSTAAEVTGNNGVYASTGGFTLATSAAGLNASGGTYIFLAVA